MSAINVIVNRPRKGVVDLVGDLAYSASLLLLRGLVVMWLAPHVINWHPGYWQSVAAVWLVSFIGQDSHRMWTRDGAK